MVCDRMDYFIVYFAFAVALPVLIEADSVTTTINPILERLKDTDDRTIANLLYSKVRIFCFIFTSSRYHDRRRMIRDTWASHCNKFVFLTGKEEDKSFPLINIQPGSQDYKSGSFYQWTKCALKYIYKHEDINSFDFFLKADDQTFVVLENLRFLLRHADGSSPVMYGRRVKTFKKPYAKMGYMLGASAFVISQEGLRLLVEKGFDKGPHCRVMGHYGEDEALSKCAWAVGVEPADSRDIQGRERFHPNSLEQALHENHDERYHLANINFYPYQEGLDCCSDTSISFIGSNVIDIELLQFCAYHWHSIGIIQDLDDLKSMLSTVPESLMPQNEILQYESDGEAADEMEKVLLGLEKQLQDVEDKIDGIKHRRKN